MAYPIKVSGLLETLDGKDLQRTDWTCDAIEPDTIDRVRRFFALGCERAAQLNAHSTLIITSETREIWAFAPPLSEAREVAQWERLIRKLRTR